MTATSRVPLNALKAFETVARNGSMRAAANEMCVTHGAVSQQIKKLEIHLDVKLVERLGRGITLTPEGQRLFDRIQPLLLQLASVSRVLDPHSETGPLRVGCTSDTAVLWLVPALPEFAAQYPGIDLDICELSAGTEMPADIDVAVINQLPEFASAQLSLLSDQYFFPVARPELVNGGDFSSIHSLKNLTLLHADRGGLWSAWHRECGLKYSEDGTRSIYLPGGAAAISGASAGLGVALAHRLEVQEALNSGSLIRLGHGKIKSAHAYFTATHSSHVSAKAELFLAWLRKKTLNSAREEF